MASSNNKLKGLTEKFGKCYMQLAKDKAAYLAILLQNFIVYLTQVPTPNLFPT